MPTEFILKFNQLQLNTIDFNQLIVLIVKKRAPNSWNDPNSGDSIVSFYLIFL
jgi:hypothetical protein